MNSGYKPRRPAQLKPEQIELIEGGADVAHSSELAHITAAVVVPLANADSLDQGVRERVQAMIDSDGIDELAQTWVTSPAQSLPGILWRGYLLREWIRRYSSEAYMRFQAAMQAGVLCESEAESIADPVEIQQLWDAVLRGGFEGDFSRTLAVSASFTDFIARVEPEWIGDDYHPLATPVTRRDTALMRTAKEFAYAADLASHHRLS